MPMREVFLSHASQDHVKAQRMRDWLVGNNIDVWFSPHHLRDDLAWQDEIGHALRRCNWFIVLLSPNAAQSMWVKRELQYALNQRRYENQIIPALLRKCELKAMSWTLPQIQIVDFQRDFTKGCAELLRILTKPRKAKAK